MDLSVFKVPRPMKGHLRVPVDALVGASIQNAENLRSPIIRLYLAAIFFSLLSGSAVSGASIACSNMSAFVS